MARRERACAGAGRRRSRRRPKRDGRRDRGIKLAKLDPQAIVGFVERHLALWPNKDAVVTVNGHVCEYHEPPIRFEHSFTPTPDEAAMIGEVELR